MHNCLIKTCLSSTTNSHNSGVTFHSIPPNLAPVYLHLSGRLLETNLQNIIDSGYQHVGLQGSTILPHKIHQIKALIKPTHYMSNNFI